MSRVQWSAALLGFKGRPYFSTLSQTNQGGGSIPPRAKGIQIPTACRSAVWVRLYSAETAETADSASKSLDNGIATGSLHAPKHPNYFPVKVADNFIHDRG